MPLWDGYDEMLKSDIADMVNAPEGGMAGAVTAALFLRRFVPEGGLWAHFDTFAWRPAARPGRPKGGDAYGLRRPPVEQGLHEAVGKGGDRKSTRLNSSHTRAHRMTSSALKQK